MASSVSRYSGKVSNVHGMPASSASTDMPSTFSSVRAIVERCSGRVGAIEPAVAHDDRRHAVPRRRRQVGIPEHLRVVVGVDVDEARGQGRGPTDRRLHVPRRPALAQVIADGGDPLVLDRDVGRSRGRSRPVHHLGSLRRPAHANRRLTGLVRVGQREPCRAGTSPTSGRWSPRRSPTRRPSSTATAGSRGRSSTRGRMASPTRS